MKQPAVVDDILSEDDSWEGEEDCERDTWRDDMAPNARFPWRSEDVASRYWVEEGKLGEGGSGIVRACTERLTGTQFACKTVVTRGMSPEKQDALCAEILLMGGLPPHPHIVNLSAVHEDANNVHIVMELCSGGDLFNLISEHGCFTEDEAVWIFRQVASAVSFCHEHGVAHLDVKPENILIAKKGQQGAEVKLADFGQAVLLKEGHILRGMAGSSFYMAPEVIEGQSYNLAADIWSLGTLLYVSLAGYLPFWSEDPTELFSLIRFAEIDFQSHPWPLISEEVKTLIRLMMSRVPSKRPTAIQILSNPWLHSTCDSPSSLPSHRLLYSIETLSLRSVCSNTHVPCNLDRSPNPNPNRNRNLNPSLLFSGHSVPSKSRSTLKRSSSVSLTLNPFNLLNSYSTSSKNLNSNGQREPSPRSPLDCTISPPATPISFFGSVKKFFLSPSSNRQNCPQNFSANSESLFDSICTKPYDVREADTNDAKNPERCTDSNRGVEVKPNRIAGEISKDDNFEERYFESTDRWESNRHVLESMSGYGGVANRQNLR